MLANVMILAVMLARTMANSFAMGVAGVVFSLAASLFYALLFLFHVREKAAFQQGGAYATTSPARQRSGKTVTPSAASEVLSA